MGQAVYKWGVVLVYRKDGKGKMMKYGIETDTEANALSLAYQEVLKDIGTEKITVKKVKSFDKELFV